MSITDKEGENVPLCPTPFSVAECEEVNCF